MRTDPLVRIGLERRKGEQLRRRDPGRAGELREQHPEIDAQGRGGGFVGGDDDQPAGLESRRRQDERPTRSGQPGDPDDALPGRAQGAGERHGGPAEQAAGGQRPHTPPPNRRRTISISMRSESVTMPTLEPSALFHSTGTWPIVSPARRAVSRNSTSQAKPSTVSRSST